MNTELLLKIKEQVLAHPEQLDMDHWGYNSSSCGAVGCIDGWACLLTYPNSEGIRRNRISVGPNCSRVVAELARELLEIQADDLFLTGCWPEAFQLRYTLTATDAERAKVVADRIDNFIEQYRTP